jgi:hypothetical protein
MGCLKRRPIFFIKHLVEERNFYIIRDKMIRIRQSSAILTSYNQEGLGNNVSW